MFTVKGGQIVITSVAAHLSQVYTPAEWNAEMLRLLDERQMALNNLALVKRYDDLNVFPPRPKRMGIVEFMQWQAATDKAIAISDSNSVRLVTYSDGITECEKQIIRLMPKGEKLFIAADESPCVYSVWWTTCFDSAGRNGYDLRIEVLPVAAPETIPLSQQFPDDDEEDLDDDTELWTDDDVREIVGDDDTSTDEPPTPDTVDDIPF